MEVHHHPHVGKKQIKEYMLEGFMIFFAVTMGFFAEQFREYMVERNHEKEIIHSLVYDLKEDHKSVRTILESYQKRIAPAGDSIKFLLLHPDAFPNDNSLYVNCRYLVRFSSINVNINNKTYTQIKNNNGFTVIKNKAVADSISRYYIYIDRIHDLENYLLVEKQEFRSMLPILLNGEMYDQVVDRNDKVIRPFNSLKARKISEDQKNQFLLKLSDINGVSRNILNRIQYLEVESERLAHFISNEYHLKEE